MPKWVRYRFHANEYDWRPIKWPPLGPCWCTGYGGDYATVIAYLPLGIDLREYWPEASQVESEERESIIFTDRFPRPDWWPVEEATHVNQ